MRASELIDMLQEQMRQSGFDPEVRVQVRVDQRARTVASAEQGGQSDRDAFGDELSCIVLRLT